MINYGYFRHRLDASNDPKLQNMIDEMGIIALGYYFSLLEIYGQNYSKMDSNGAVHIHQRVVANTWRKRVDSCDKVLTKLQLSDLLVYTKCKNTYQLSIPNFPKYFGSYQKKKDVKTPNKSKEKESKEKYIPPNPQGGLYTEIVNDIINEFNLVTGKKYRTDSHVMVRNIIRWVKAGFEFDDFKKVIDIKNRQWAKDSEMEKFLRPETIFGDRFETYLNEWKEPEEEYKTPEHLLW